MKNHITEEMLNGLVVLIIDMQPKYVDTSRKKDIIPNQINVLNFCKSSNIPVIVVSYRGDGDLMPALSEVVETSPEDKVYKLTKSTDSAFSSTNIKSLLDSLNAKTLLIMGVNACACVFDTANHAVDYGFKVITSKDLIAGYCGCCSKSVRETWYAKNACYPGDHKEILNVFIKDGQPDPWGGKW